MGVIDIMARLAAAGCVFAEDEANLLLGASRSPAELAAMVDQRVAGLPIEQIVGWAEFCGLRILVGPGVFVPRRRTEFLVRQALADLPASDPVVILDVCCGSGALGLAVAAGLGTRDVALYASDVDVEAVRWARANLEPVGGRVFSGDLFEPIPADLRGRTHILLANAPYVPTDEIALLPAEARLYEPIASLDGGPDGLDVVRRVIDEAPQWLAPGGRLLVETTAPQLPALLDAMAAAGLTARTARSSRLHATVVVGSRTPAG